MSASEMSLSSPTRRIPALLTRMSRPPSSATVFSTEA